MGDKERLVTYLRQHLQLDEDQAAELADRAEEIFLSETGRMSVPGRAFWLWVDLAKLIHSEAAGGAAGTDGVTSGPVTSIKRGDTAIQYGSAADSVQGTSGTVMDRVRSWKVVRKR